MLLEHAVSGWAPMRIDMVTDVDFSAFPWVVANFAPEGTEQDAMAEFLVETTSLASPYGQADTPPDMDGRILNLWAQGDTALAGCP